MPSVVSTASGEAGEKTLPFPVRLARGTDAVMLWSASVVASVTLPLLFISICVDVVIRNITKQSISWLSDVQAILFPWLIVSGVVIAALWGRHIALDAVIRILPGTVGRFLLLCVQILVAMTFFYLGWVGIEVLDVVGGEVFPVTGLKTSWAYLALVTGFLFLAITALTNIVFLFEADDPFVFRWGLEEEAEPSPNAGPDADSDAIDRSEEDKR